jgi:hypothetical protein
MKKQIKYFVLLSLLCVTAIARADEGMWLLQLMQEQHSIDLMKKAGLRLKATDIYNPNGVSLKDAVGIFGGGCTGEIISADGLILTNHHCGYASIQTLSSVEHDYLTNGFWAKSRSEELAAPKLTFTFVAKIIDVTDRVNADIKAGKITEVQSLSGDYRNKLAEEMKENSEFKGKKYINADVQPFYAGNCFYLIYYKVYSDVRMVAAPPSSIGKFGGETDNWMWPRHTCDFSMFRIYADKNGEPAPYSKDNVPLKTLKHLTISLKGVKDGDYAMVMGFPGRTSRYLTVTEVKNRMDNANDPRIKVRTAYLDVLKKEMASSDKIRIQYANKFAGSSNYWKNSIGMNKAIIDNKVLDTKAQQEKAFEKFAKNKPEYQGVVDGIEKIVTKEGHSNYRATTVSEIGNAVELTKLASLSPRMDAIKNDLNKKDEAAIQKDMAIMKIVYQNFNNKDYDVNVDRKVAKALLPLMAQMLPAEELPDIYTVINTKYNGDFNKFVDDMYDHSIFTSQANFDAFIKSPTAKALDEDLSLQYASSAWKTIQGIYFKKNTADDDNLALLHKKYIRGLNEMKKPAPAYPDANFTMRLTYGNVKSYNPKDGVTYRYYTTTDGVPSERKS